MTREEKIICKDFLNDADKTHSCNEYKLLMELLEQETVSKEVYDHEYFLRKEFELKIDKLQHQFEKIRSEIQDLPTSTCTETCWISIDADDLKENVLAIFDKYKAESKEI